MRLGDADAAAIIKVGRHLGKIRALLERLGLIDRARYVERASLATQRVAAAARSSRRTSAPYFSMVLVYAGGSAMNRRYRRARPPAGWQRRAGCSAARWRGARLCAASLGGCAVSFADVAPHLHGAVRRRPPDRRRLRRRHPDPRARAAAFRQARRAAGLAVAEDGSAAVPLLGGHRGANALARRLAAALGGHAAITTAGDLRFGLALDEPPPGWRARQPRGREAASWRRCSPAQPAKLEIEAAVADAIALCRLPRMDRCALVAIDPSRNARRDSRTARLLFTRAGWRSGFGCERGRRPGGGDRRWCERCLGRSRALPPRQSPASPRIDLKADEPAVHAGRPPSRRAGALLPARRGWRPRRRGSPIPPELVFREVGCHGVAEGAALAAAGPDGDARRAEAEERPRHLRHRRSARDSSIPTASAAPRGRLAIVGIGPGAADG